MIRLPFHRPLLRIDVLLLAWVLVFGLTWADSVDLSDDVLAPLSGLPEAMGTDVDDSKGTPATLVAATLSGALAFSEPLLTSSTSPAFVNLPPAAPGVPVYQAVCTYRI